MSKQKITHLHYVLIYSVDDENETGKGWYYEERCLGRGGNWRSSQLFETEQEARQAFGNGHIKWED